MPAVLCSDADPAEAIALGRDVGQKAAPFAAQHDRDATFVSEGYAAVRETGYGVAAVPKELGGGGHGLNAVCRAQAEIARGCASTSLAIAMHQHCILTMAWRWSRGDTEVEPVLRRVVDQGLILAFGGSLALTNTSPVAEPRNGGFVVRGSRRLCSGSPGADVMVCVARLTTPSGVRPLRLLVPLQADGVEIVDDWYSMGMRGSGSNTVKLDGVVVAANNALYVDQLRPRLRPPPDRGGPDRAGPPTTGLPQRWRSANVLSPGLHIALTVIAASYLGAASGACDEAIRLVAGTSRADSEASPRLAGLMIHEARVGWWALEGMLRDTTDESVGSRAQMVTTMLGKRQVILSSIRTVELAMELLGSMSYMKTQIFERTLRDVRAGLTHPLTPEETLAAVGRANLVLDSGRSGR